MSLILDVSEFSMSLNVDCRFCRFWMSNELKTLGGDTGLRLKAMLSPMDRWTCNVLSCTIVGYLTLFLSRGVSCERKATFSLWTYIRRGTADARRRFAVQVLPYLLRKPVKIRAPALSTYHRV